MYHKMYHRNVSKNVSKNVSQKCITKMYHNVSQSIMLTMSTSHKLDMQKKYATLCIELEMWLNEFLYKDLPDE